MKQSEIEKYWRPVRILHWVHSGAFIVLFLTGLVFFVPQFRSLAENGNIRLIHHAAATIFIIVPLFYIFINPNAVARGLKLAFSWGADDLKWLKAAPRYYLLGDEKSLPPQGFFSSGQKMWWLVTIVAGVIFTVTGLVMWFFKVSAPPGFLGVIINIHDITFIATGALFLLHLYLGVFHPLMSGAWNAMAKGKITEEYAKKHHARWYAEISRDEELKGNKKSPED